MMAASADKRRMAPHESRLPGASVEEANTARPSYGERIAVAVPAGPESPHGRQRAPSTPPYEPPAIIWAAEDVNRGAEVASKAQETHDRISWDTTKTGDAGSSGKKWPVDRDPNRIARRSRVAD